jgi:hypothetical protein
VLTAALVGTERGPSIVDGPEALLDASAALAVARRAGARPILGLATGEPAPVETAPVALPAAVVRLGGLLAGDRLPADVRVELLAEWLRCAATRGWLVPPELLPALLDTARTLKPLHPLIASTGGARAGWLAARNPEWSYLLAEVDPGSVRLDDRSAWEDGPIGRRIGYLTEVRRRDPPSGLALVEQTWAQETPEDRIRLVEALRVGLGSGDEDFLERALDDRRREVRAAAVELLTVLPGAGYGARMAERARACVVPQPMPRLVVRPPAACDRAMRRDGIAPRPPAGVGERAWWLEEVLARAPLDIWTGYAETPSAFLHLEVDAGWSGVLHRGLARAAASQHDAGWAGALLDRLEPQLAGNAGPDDVLLLEALYEAVPAGDRAEWAVRALGRPNAPGLQRLLELCPAPWPAPLAVAFCAQLAGLVRRAGAVAWRVAEWCRLGATRLPYDEALLDELLAGLPGADSANRRSVERLADILRFRHEMTEELR